MRWNKFDESGPTSPITAAASPTGTTAESEGERSFFSSIYGRRNIMTDKMNTVENILASTDGAEYTKPWLNFIERTDFTIHSAHKIKNSVIKIETNERRLIVKLHAIKKNKRGEWWRVFYPSLNRMPIEADGLRWLECQDQTHVLFPRLLATDEHSFLVAEWISGRRVDPKRPDELAALGRALAAFHAIRPGRRTLKIRIRHGGWAFRRFIGVACGAWSAGAPGLWALAQLALLMIFRRRRQLHVQHNDFHLGQAVLKVNGQVAIIDFGQPLVSRFPLVDIIKIALSLEARSQPFLSAYIRNQDNFRWRIDEIRMCGFYHLLASLGKRRGKSPADLKRIDLIKSQLFIFNSRHRTKTWAERVLFANGP